MSLKNDQRKIIGKDRRQIIIFFPFERPPNYGP
jgi:hypothetical protein